MAIANCLAGQHLESRPLKCFSRGCPLRVRELGGHRDDRLAHLQLFTTNEPLDSRVNGWKTVMYGNFKTHPVVS
jgi:hypothetical protein